jgi:hypothetical protein
MGGLISALINSASSRRQDQQQQQQFDARQKQVETQQGLDALGLMTSLREHEEGYSADIDRILTQRQALAAGVQTSSQNLSLVQGLGQPEATNRANMEYQRALGALDAADTEMATLAQRRSLARRQSEEVSSFLSKRGLLTEGIAMREQVQQLQMPPAMGGESFNRPAYRSPNDQRGAAPQSMEAEPQPMGEQAQPAPAEAPQSPMAAWQQIAQSRSLDPGEVTDKGIRITAPDAETQKQLQKKYEELAPAGTTSPFYVDDISQEEADSMEYLKGRAQSYEGTREKMMSTKRAKAMLDRASLPSASDAIVAAAMKSMASAEDADQFTKDLGAAAQMASPEERRAIVKEMKTHFDEIVADYEGILEESEPEYQEFRARGRKKSGMKEEKSIELAPGEDESEFQFAKRYAEAAGWDFTKKLTPAQQKKIKAAYAGK